MLFTGMFFPPYITGQYLQLVFHFVHFDFFLCVFLSLRFGIDSCLFLFPDLVFFFEDFWADMVGVINHSVDLGYDFAFISHMLSI